MSEKTTREKLQVLLPHWIDHNHGHAAEFAKWASEARKNGEEEVADLIDRAAGIVTQADALLAEALAKIGGPAPGHHHHHHD